MLQATKKSDVNPANLAGKKIALVASSFNSDVVDGLLNGALTTLECASFASEHYEVFRVPGAFEIPLIAKKIAASKRFDGVITLGCVIRGETPHFEFVSLAATMGCLQAGLDTGCPVLFGVITVNTPEQAQERSQPNEFNKGREAVLALFDLWKTMEQI